MLPFHDFEEITVVFIKLPESLTEEKYGTSRT